MSLRVLIACEYSGTVRRAFRALGHEAWSCDLLPSDDDSPFHQQCDALGTVGNPFGAWDLVIAHPPCTFLANSVGGVTTTHRYRIADLEAGALKRLKAIVGARNSRASVIAELPAMQEPIDFFHQTDPRGCALYLVKRSDLNGQPIEQVYSRGLAVCA